MKLTVQNSCPDFDSYRAARVKSLFNVEDGSSFQMEADLPIEDLPWSVGLIVGPSGSGKTSLGRRVFAADRMARLDWPEDEPIIDVIARRGDFDSVTAALASVGLGSVPSWLRPYHVLSNGEKFRADLARIVCDQPEEIVIDEFTSVVDRQIAKVGALAFGKAWRRTKGRAVLCPATTTLSIGWIRIGSMTRRQVFSPGGVIGNGPRLPWKSARPTGNGGPILSRIII